MIRTYSVSKLGATKESWKEVIRSLQDSQNTEGWSLLLLLVLIYTRLLRSMGDDAFYPSSNLDSASTDRNPLQLEDVRSLAELARNIAFALYWNPPERLRVGRINLDGIRDTFRKLAVALHERECGTFLY